MEGGGWCSSKDGCLDRSKTKYGSSHLMENQTYFGGSLDTECQFNPDFCDWHKVYIHYCDGSSFMSDIEKIDPETNLSFRGARIFDVMMEEMLAKGMGNAENAILTGTSAGGLATILHCDIFQALLPNTCRVKCVSDSGFFIHGRKDHPGFKISENRFAGVVETHELANSLPTSCTSTRNPDLCLFPEYLVDDIQTPLFILESAFDMYQSLQVLEPGVDGEEPFWKKVNRPVLSFCKSGSSWFGS